MHTQKQFYEEKAMKAHLRKFPKVSIIIPLYVISSRFFEDLETFRRLDYPNFEVIVVCDRKVKVPSWPNLRLILTGQRRTGPAEKRDLAIKKAKGEICAFIDDDSYPGRNWLRNAVRIFKQHKGVSVVCGPGLTPPENSFLQKLSGAVLCSIFGSGIYTYRFRQEKERFVDDFPAYNMIVKREILLKIGGFNTKFYGGEDTALCLKITRVGERILYVPDVIVYHHRRFFPKGFLRQISNVGLHRGYFVKKYPQTSKRLIYFFPSGLIFILLLAPFLLFLGRITFPLVVFLFLGTYALIVLDGLHREKPLVAVALPVCILLTHLTYGINFIKGLLTKRLTR